MDSEEVFNDVQVDGTRRDENSPSRRTRSASQRKRKAKRGLTDITPSPPPSVPLPVIPAPPMAAAPPPENGTGGTGGRSRAWMLSNLRNGGDGGGGGGGGATVVATSPETTSEDRASTVAAYPLERAGGDAATAGPDAAPPKKMKKVKKGSAKSAASPSVSTPGGVDGSTPSTALHYVDYDQDDALATPIDDKRKRSATTTTAAVMDTLDGYGDEGEVSIFDDAAKKSGTAHPSDGGSDSGFGPLGKDDPFESRRESMQVGTEVARNDHTRGLQRRELSDGGLGTLQDDGVNLGKVNASTRVRAAAGVTEAADKNGAMPGVLDFYALPRLMRLQQAFEAHRTRLYNFCACHVLEWPTMAVEWIPDRRFADPERDYTLQYVAVGTQAGRGHRNSVRVMEVAVPVYTNSGAMYNLFGDDDINGATGATAEEFEAMVDPGKLFRNIRGHFHTDQVVNVDSAVLKIKAMPAETNTIAVKTGSGLIKIYNLVRELAEDESGLTTPEVTLLGHSVGGFGLSWSSAKLGYIASGSDDGYVNYWDISHNLTAGMDAEALAAAQASHVPDMMGSEVQPIQRLAGHRDIVTDVSCHHSQGHLIASSSMDGDVRIWDIRSNESSNMTIPEAHEGGATAAQFHPLGDFQIATAGADGSIGLWDIRHSRREVSSLAYHGKSVTGLQWAPFKETVLASYGEDGRVVFWDLAKTTLPMSYSEDAMAPPEVAFVHTGHLGRVTDFSWSSGKDDNWLVASADTMNGAHFYQPRIDIVEDYRVDKQFAGMRR